MRTAEKPLRSGLVVAELTVEVLGRIEELKALEREREELVGEVSAAMEAQGYDTGAVKAVMEG